MTDKLVNGVDEAMINLREAVESCASPGFGYLQWLFFLGDFLELVSKKEYESEYCDRIRKTWAFNASDQRTRRSRTPGYDFELVEYLLQLR